MSKRYGFSIILLICILLSGCSYHNQSDTRESYKDDIEKEKRKDEDEGISKKEDTGSINTETTQNNYTESAAVEESYDESVYADFLAGIGAAIVDENYSETYDIVTGYTFTPGEVITLSDFVNRIEYDEFKNIKYAYFDSGLDGLPELAVCLTGEYEYGEKNDMIVLKYKNGSVYVTYGDIAILEKNFIHLYRYGLINNTISAGTGCWTKTNDILDGDGYGHKLYSEMMNSDFMSFRDNEQWEEMADILGMGDLCVINYEIEGQEYQSYQIYTTDTGKLEKIYKYLSWCMENVNDFIPMEEIDDKITAIKANLRYNAQVYDETEVVWLDLY